MQGFLDTLKGFGLGRLVAIGGIGVGVAAVTVALLLKMGGQPQALLYSNLDPKEASQVTSALDAAGVKYEARGDGTTIMVDRDKVASSRLLVAGKGLVTSGSVGYEIFDAAPSLGQTDFVQHLNQQRALEGELARTIRGVQGVTGARVLLNMPKRQLFDDDADAQASASVMISSGRRLGSDQVRAIRNLVASAAPNLKPERITVADEQGLLAGAGDSDTAAAMGQTGDYEERLRKTVLNLVEGVVGPGSARVQVTADLDMARTTTSEEKFDPDGQVVRSTSTGDDKSQESKSSQAGGVSASQNIPGATPGAAGSGDSNTSAKTDETTNYEISKKTTTQVIEPGQVKRLSVSVAVDGVTGAPVHGKPGPYMQRTPDEMAKIDQLVKAAVGFDPKRGDQVSVVNVRFDQPQAEAAAKAGLDFDSNDMMRLAELAVMGITAALLVFFVLRPMVKPGAGGGSPALPPQQKAAAGGAPIQVTAPDGSTQYLPAPTSELEQRIDIAKIEGQVKVSSVKRVAEFVEKHPEESVSILRSWLHETA